MGRFYFNCEHVLIVNIKKTKKKRISRILWKKCGFSRFEVFLSKTQIFQFLIIHKPSLGCREVPNKIWARSVQPFWRLLDTNGQTYKLNLCIDIIDRKKIAIIFLQKMFTNVYYVMFQRFMKMYHKLSAKSFS